MAPMTYYGGKELASAFGTVRRNTIQIAEEIPEEKYDFRPAPEVRTIGENLLHIVLAPTFQYHVHGEAKLSTMEGFDFMGLMGKVGAEHAKPHTKAEIIEKLKTDGERLEKWLSGLSEAFLAETVSLPPNSGPASKTRFEMIMSIKEHEMHHRGQVMLTQRMIGQTPHMTRTREANMAKMREAAQAKG